MSYSKFCDVKGNCSNEIGDHCDDQNHGLVNNQILDLHQMNQPLESDGANMYFAAPTNGVPLQVSSAMFPNHAPFQSMSAQINQNQSAQHEAYPQQFGTAADYAMSQEMVNAQHLPLRWGQLEGAIKMVNPPISPQINLGPLVKPGSSQSSNISYADHERRLRKQECDRRSRAKKEKTRKDNEERLVKVTEENNQLRNDNGSFKEGEVAMKKEIKDFKEKISHLEKQVSYLNNKLRGQNTKMDVLSDKLVATSESADLVGENKELKRKIEMLSTPLKDHDSMKIVELLEEIGKWKRKAKRLQVINEALCDKMNNDEQ